jgi:hypothetical protein
MKKTVFTLNVDKYAPQITALTYPLLRYYAQKIGADFHIIDQRKFPDYPVTYEKMQIFDLAKEMKNDWNIYIDSDALIHPETPDWTEHMHKQTVAHNGIDMANIRWRYDNYFRRDGRNVGSCNWFTIASDWCVDLWHPLDITIEEAIANIYPTVDEQKLVNRTQVVEPGKEIKFVDNPKAVIKAEHLIDDYTLSRNIARFGLKCTTLRDIQEKIGLKDGNFHWHLYTITEQQKVEELTKVIAQWEIPDNIMNFGK